MFDPCSNYKTLNLTSIVGEISVKLSGENDQKSLK